MLPQLFRAMDPADDLAWLAVADWLEENGETGRAELVRLTRCLRHETPGKERTRREERLIALLAAGVEPCAATLTNSIGMEFVFIPAGTFRMGSPPKEANRGGDEGPLHEVEITRGFFLGKYPVTQAEYQVIMAMNPSHFSTTGKGKRMVKGADTGRFPVESVTYREAKAFCKQLGGQAEEKKQSRLYRLPTEAEWEYSCRAGIGSKPYYFGKSLVVGLANYLQRKARMPAPVGSYPPNAFGLHDMHGTVWEWCADWYKDEYYESSPRSDPAGPDRGGVRVTRGGSWAEPASFCRSATRGINPPDWRNNELGFRVCFGLSI